MILFLERWMILESTSFNLVNISPILMVVRGRVVRGRKECTFSNNYMRNARLSHGRKRPPSWRQSISQGCHDRFINLRHYFLHSGRSDDSLLLRMEVHHHLILQMLSLFPYCLSNPELAITSPPTKALSLAPSQPSSATTSEPSHFPSAQPSSFTLTQVKSSLPFLCP